MISQSLLVDIQQHVLEFAKEKWCNCRDSAFATLWWQESRRKRRAAQEAAEDSDASEFTMVPGQVKACGFFSG